MKALGISHLIPRQVLVEARLLQKDATAVPGHHLLFIRHHKPPSPDGPFTKRQVRACRKGSDKGSGQGKGMPLSWERETIMMEYHMTCTWTREAGSGKRKAGSGN